MNSTELALDTSDELIAVELQIARRADELSRQERADARSWLDHWRQAEDEVWQSLIPAD